MEIREWAAPAIFAGHALDEFISGFPAWATRHYGTTSLSFYLTSHLALTAGVVFATQRRKEQPALLGTVASAFIANGIFHLNSSRRQGERSPGSVTAQTLLIPGGIYLLRDLIRKGDLDARDITASILGGLALNAAAVGSLRLDMPKLGRRPSGNP